jgi:hypothetical protein
MSLLSLSSAWQLKKAIKKSVRNSRVKRGHTESWPPNAQPSMRFRRQTEDGNNAKSDLV